MFAASEGKLGLVFRISLDTTEALRASVTAWAAQEDMPLLKLLGLPEVQSEEKLKELAATVEQKLREQMTTDDCRLGG